MKKNLLLIFLLFITSLTNAADWTKVSISVSDAKDFTFLKIDDNRCYAFFISGTYPNCITNILKTIDCGGTWTPVTQTGLNLGDNVYKADSSLPNTSNTISSETGQVLSKSNFTDRSITIKCEKFASGFYIYSIRSDKQLI